MVVNPIQGNFGAGKIKEREREIAKKQDQSPTLIVSLFDIRNGFTLHLLRLGGCRQIFVPVLVRAMGKATSLSMLGTLLTMEESSESGGCWF